MRFDDRTRDRQSHAHAVRLCGVKSIEQPVEILRPDTDTHVLHGDEDLVGVVTVRRISNVRARSVTVAMACMPLTTRLMITCWSWIRSP